MRASCRDGRATIEIRPSLAGNCDGWSVLDDWMPIVHFLNRHGRNPRRSREVRTIDHCLASLSSRSGRHRPARTGGQVANGGAMHWSASNRGHSFDGKAAIDNSCLVHRVVINDGSVVVNASHLRCRQPVVAQVALVEIMEANKSEMIGTKPEIEIQSYVHAIESPTKPHFENRARR